MTYEYEYRVALAWFRSKYPDPEIEENPFGSLPKDDNMPIEDEVSFNDSFDPSEAFLYCEVMPLAFLYSKARKCASALRSSMRSRLA